MLPGHICGEGSHVLEEVGTVSALHILHHHAEVFPRLEAAVHGDNKGIVRKGHDVPLGKHLFNLKNRKECALQHFKVYIHF